MNKPKLIFKTNSMNKKEAEDVFSFLTRTCVDVLKISYEESERRVKKLMQSDILNGDPQSPLTQKKIDAFLNIPSRDHHLPPPFTLQSQAYQDAFIYSLSSKDLIENYDRLTGSNLYDCMQAMEKNGIDYKIDLATGRTQAEIKKFEKFFQETIWSRFSHHQNQVKNN